MNISLWTRFMNMHRSVQSKVVRKKHPAIHYYEKMLYVEYAAEVRWDHLLHGRASNVVRTGRSVNGNWPKLTPYRSETSWPIKTKPNTIPRLTMEHWMNIGLTHSCVLGKCWKTVTDPLHFLLRVQRKFANIVPPSFLIQSTNYWYKHFLNAELAQPTYWYLVQLLPHLCVNLSRMLVQGPCHATLTFAM
jgi:hypothetical protein